MSVNDISPERSQKNILNRCTVVLGSQWGDEGKGKLTDMLACKADIVCRCQGGDNAGHTVVVNGVEYVFCILPIGVTNKNCSSIIGNGVVINLGQFFKEVAENEGKGLASCKGRVFVSDRAHIVFDFCRSVDHLQEQQKGKNSIGTTKKGIGPTYSSKTNRSGLRLADLLGDFSVFEEKLRNLLKSYMQQYSDLNVDVDNEIKKYKVYAKSIAPFVTDTVTYLHNALKNGKKIVIEGANAAMLDIDFGCYPYVTSSNCTIGGTCTGLGIPPQCIGDIYGVVKAYSTRLGKGPFPTELTGDLGDKLQTVGQEFQVLSTKKRRCGWLDINILRYSNMINGYTGIALMKLDVLDTFEEIKIGVAYRLNNKCLEIPPVCATELAKVEVEYMTLPGWKTSIKQVRKFSDLPFEAQKYVRTIEKLTAVRVKWIGVGRDRSAIIEVY